MGRYVWAEYKHSSEMTEEEKERAKCDVALLPKILPWAEGGVEEMERVQEMAGKLLDRELKLRGEKEQMMKEIEAEIKRRTT
mgnify:CR=1 FL=1